MEGNVVLTMRDISKTFPGVKALQHVDFTLRKGEIHALMGENGAGKSTLIKVLTGVHEFENGEIRLDGKDGPIINKSPQDAQNNGISTVYQEVNLCPNLTVAENLFIGHQEGCSRRSPDGRSGKTELCTLQEHSGECKESGREKSGDLIQMCKESDRGRKYPYR